MRVRDGCEEVKRLRYEIAYVIATTLADVLGGT